MTERDTPVGLRAARLARGWSQAEAAREIATMARSRGAPVAAAASLKTLLSRWENGHSLPEQQYRQLLADLYGRSVAELGLAPADPPGPRPAEQLTAALAAAEAVQRDGVRLWRQQLELARALDDELGVAGAGGLVEAQVEQLAGTLVHTVPRPARSELAELLAEAAVLSGTQALDRTRHDHAWRRFDQARTAAREADLPTAGAAAVAGQAELLVDVGEPGAAVLLLQESDPGRARGAQARLDAALAMAQAAAGEAAASRRAMGSAARRLQLPRTDRVERATGPPVELADLHRWHGRVLVTLGDPGAVGPLQQALAAAPRSTRHRAAIHADLAITLRAHRPEEAAAHADTARKLAVGIGSERIPARLTSRPPGASGSDDTPRSHVGAHGLD